MAEDQKAGGSEPYIQFIRVSKSFGEQTVLNDVSFEVRRGETAVVLGRSGVGKSVTLKHIMGVLQRDSGEVRVGGDIVSQMAEEQRLELHRQVTMVCQSGAVFDSLSAGENVAYPLREQAAQEE